jgi:ferredoxin
MEETNYCQYIQTICNGGDCSTCSTYFKYKRESEDRYKQQRKSLQNASAVAKSSS